MRPYLSIDIETTGLNREQAEVLEIAYIADDLYGKIETLPFKATSIDLKVFKYAEPYALKMNSKLIDELSNSSIKKYSVEEAFKTLYDFTLWLGNVCYEWDLKNGPAEWATKKVCFCGKNAATFDVPVLKNFFARHGVDQKALDHWSSHISHRVMDVGSMYFPKFGTIPSLSEINKITGRTDVKHRALDDALDVVYAVRHVLGVRPDGRA